MLHIFHIWKFVFRLCNVWKQGQVKVYMAQEINSEHIRLSCMGNLCQISFWRELFSKHFYKFVLWECWSASAFCSDESMTNFGNHQRKKFSKTFFFGIDLRNFDPSIFTFELVNCFVELPLISQSCNKQLLKKQICWYNQVSLVGPMQ